MEIEKPPFSEKAKATESFLERGSGKAVSVTKDLYTLYPTVIQV